VIGIPTALWGSSIFMAVAVGAVLMLPEVRNLPAEPTVSPGVSAKPDDQLASDASKRLASP
jgi:hypothetical protein